MSGLFGGGGGGDKRQAIYDPKNTNVLEQMLTAMGVGTALQSNPNLGAILGAPQRGPQGGGGIMKGGGGGGGDSGSMWRGPKGNLPGMGGSFGSSMGAQQGVNPAMQGVNSAISMAKLFGNKKRIPAGIRTGEEAKPYLSY